MTVFNIFCPSNFDDLRVQISWFKNFYLCILRQRKSVQNSFWYLTKKNINCKKRMCKDAWECYASRNIFFLDLRWINLHQQQWLQARYSVVLSWGVYTSEFAASRQIYSLSYWNSPFIKIGHCYTFYLSKICFNFWVLLQVYVPC